MKQKNGFMATSLLYAFFILFVALMMGIIANYAHNRILIKNANEEVAKKLGKKLEENFSYGPNDVSSNEAGSLEE